MYERFTDRARKVMQLANEEARRLNHKYIGPEHILLGLIKLESGVAITVLKNLEVSLSEIQSGVEKIIGRGSDDVVIVGKFPQTPRGKRVIEYSMEEAHGLGHNYVGTEHLLMGLLREKEGVAAHVLMNAGLSVPTTREEVLTVLNFEHEDPEDTDDE